MGRLYMDATVTPNRALSPRGFRILIGVFAALNLVVAGVMLAIGAVFIPVFLGADVLALTVAFLILFRRQARQEERVRVSAEAVEVSRHDRVAWSSPPALTRVEITEREEAGPRVALSRSGRSLLVGAALSPKERAAFGRALVAAVDAARRERWPAEISAPAGPSAA